MSKWPIPSAPSSSEQNTGSPSKRGTQDHTILAARSMSALKLQLPMTARFECVHVVASRARRPCRTRSRDIPSPATPASQSRSAATPATRQEASLEAGAPIRIECPPARLTTRNASSSVTSSPMKTGRRPENGALGAETRHDVALVRPRGADLRHHLAALQDEAGGKPASQVGGEPVASRPRAPARPDSGAAMLAPLSSITSRRRRRRKRKARRAPRRCRSRRTARGGPRRAWSRRSNPCKPGGAQPQRREQQIQRLQRPAAHQRQRAAEPVEKRGQDRQQPPVHAHRIGGRSAISSSVPSTSRNSAQSSAGSGRARSPFMERDRWRRAGSRPAFVHLRAHGYPCRRRAGLRSGALSSRDLCLGGHKRYLANLEFTRASGCPARWSRRGPAAGCS